MLLHKGIFNRKNDREIKAIFGLRTLFNIFGARRLEKDNHLLRLQAMTEKELVQCSDEDIYGALLTLSKHDSFYVAPGVIHSFYYEDAEEKLAHLTHESFLVLTERLLMPHTPPAHPHP